MQVHAETIAALNKAPVPDDPVDNDGVLVKDDPAKFTASVKDTLQALLRNSKVRPPAPAAVHRHPARSQHTAQRRSAAWPETRPRRGE